MWRSSISTLIILLAISSYSQSLGAAKDFVPSLLELGVDVGKAATYGYHLLSNHKYGQNEFHASVDFNRILLDFDYGLGRVLRKNPLKRADKNKYPVKIISDHWGHYFKVGLSYNFLPQLKDNNAAFLGCMYSWSTFREALYGNYVGKFKAYNSTVDVNTAGKFLAHWAEIIAGVRVQLWSWMYMGCTVRYKFFKHISKSQTLIPFDIIGWGLNEHEDALGINYYIGIQIPLRTKEPPMTPAASDK